MTYKIISCDGGGVRGYITAKLILQLNLETEGRLLGEADAYVGTSTGGLIAVGLGAGLTIGDIVQIYEAPKEIFTENTDYPAADHRSAPERSGAPKDTGPGKLACQYTADGLKTVLGPKLGTKTLGDLGAGKLVAVNTAQLDNMDLETPNWEPVTFNNLNIGGWNSVSLLDACLCTSAAPTYFPPNEVGGIFYADGGTFANNPVLNGIDLARKSGLVGDLSDIQVVSLGTGLQPMCISASTVGDPLSWGVDRWMLGTPSLLDLMFDLSAENLTGIAQGLLGRNMVRLNPTLTTPVPLDGVDPEERRIMDTAVQNFTRYSPAWSAAKAMVTAW